MADKWVKNKNEDNNIKYCYILHKVIPFLLFSGGNIKDKDPIVDPKFVALLKTTLARLAGSEKLDFKLIGLDFWARWPKKFREKKRYVKTCENKQSGKRYVELDLEQDNEPETTKEPPLVNLFVIVTISALLLNNFYLTFLYRSEPSTRLMWTMSILLCARGNRIRSISTLLSGIGAFPMPFEAQKGKGKYIILPFPSHFPS